MRFTVGLLEFAFHLVSRHDAPRMWEIVKEFARFLRREKRWWLVPLVVLLLLMGLLLVFSSTSPLAPFLYPLF